jgi:3-isopropylmalate/(R)-2-methylmalate dehydratase small subunit
MMEPFQTVTGVAVPYLADDVNTDEITPVHRSLTPDFAELLFARRKRLADGSLDPSFPLNKVQFAKAAVLVAGRNFGCGSSRESAVWAMLAVGIKVIVARSFADIYRDNCLKNGLLPVVLSPADQDAFERAVIDTDGAAPVVVDLAAKTITSPIGTDFAFAMDATERTALLEGLDDIGVTLREEEAIRNFEARVATDSPWLITAPATQVSTDSSKAAAATNRVTNPGLSTS